MQPRILNLFKIKVLSEVCKTNSYKVASGNLFITPSAISKIIKSLEAEWHVKLVQSSGNNIKVTDDAKKLALIAEKMLTANDEFIKKLADLNGQVSGALLKMGSGGTNSRIMMNKLMAFLLKLYPDLEYEVSTNNSAETLRGVENMELDCGVVCGTLPADVDRELLFEDYIYLYAHRTHPLAGKSIMFDDIAYPVCFREKGSSTRQLVEQYLLDNNKHIKNIKQTGKNDELTDHLCRTNNALQFLTDFYFQNSQWKNDYVKIDCLDLHIPIQIYFIVRKNFPFLKLKKHICSHAFKDEFTAS